MYISEPFRSMSHLLYNVIDVITLFIISVCSLYFLFGIVCTFLGYRCFKMIMFLYGFIFGSIVVYLICAEENVLPGMDLGTLGGSGHWAVYYTSPKIFITTFSYSFGQQLWGIVLNFDWLVY